MRLLSLLLLLAAAPAVAAAQPSADTLATAIDRYIHARAEADSFSGAVLVARNGVPILRRGYGLADRDKRAPVTPETKFNLGSIDKLITRIAIWQLVAAGKLRLDVPIGTYLPDYPNRDVREHVTARQLYQMRSGIGDIFNDEFRRRSHQIRTVDDYLSVFVNEPLRFQPGTSMAYSNGGYIVLGKLIEQLSGQSYYDYVVANITGPTGMRDTRHYLVDERVPNRAIGYTAGFTTRSGSLRPNTESLAGRGSPAGGGYSTVDDFLKLDAALRAGTLIPGAFADSVLPAGFRAGGAEPLNYGGGGPGTNTHYSTFPDGWTIILFTNMDPPAAGTVSREIARSLGKTLPGPTRMQRRPGGSG